MMTGIREAVAKDKFAGFSAAFMGEMEKGDIPEHP